MKPFKDIRVYPNYRTGHYIEWDLNPLFRAPIPFNFYLEASEVEDFSVLIFSNLVGDVFSTIDTSGLKHSLTQNYIYRIKLITGNGNIFYSNSIILGNIPGGRMKYAAGCEVMRLEQVAQRYAGQAAFLLKRKTYGIIDTTAVDPVSGAVIDDNVNSYGTSIVGGYYPPIPISIRAPTDKNQVRRLNPDGNGIDEVFSSMTRMIGFPCVSEEDIIVTQRDNIFHNVMGVQPTYFPGIGMRVLQTISLRSIPTTDTIYQIVLPQ